MIPSLARAAYGILILTMKTVALMAGTAIVVGLVFNGANGPPRDEALPDAKSLHLTDDHGRVIVSLEDDKQDIFTKFLLRDKKGNSLMNGRVYQDKSITFSLGDELDVGHVGTVGYTKVDNKICIGVRNGKSAYQLSLWKDGSSEVELVELDTRVVHRFHVTPEGTVVDDQPVELRDK